MASNCCLAQTKSLRAQVESIANRTLLVRESPLHISGQLHKLLQPGRQQSGNYLLSKGCSVQWTRHSRSPKTVISRASTLPLCLQTSQFSHAADPCSSILLTKDHKSNPKSCWEEFLHCTFHERLPSPSHLGLLHSCLAFSCPNFHGPQGPTKK